MSSNAVADIFSVRSDLMDFPEFDAPVCRGSADFCKGVLRLIISKSRLNGEFREYLEAEPGGDKCERGG